MSINIFPSGPYATNAYLITCTETRQAAIVDPSPDSHKPLISFITQNNLQPTHILITHSHWDHIADTSILKAKYQIPVLIHSLDAKNLMEPGSDRIPFPIDISPVTQLTHLKEGDIITIGKLRLTVIHTPGHSPGCICFYCPEKQFLLSGDTLFRGTIGNLNLPTGQPNLMANSLKKLSKLPPSTKVYPGHGPATTIGGEPWLADPESEFEML